MLAHNAGDYERALGAFRKAAEVGQPSSDLWSFQAKALTNLKRVDEALKCWEQAVALDDKNATAWQALGIAAYKDKNHERALAAFRKAAEVGQPTAELWVFQAVALQALARSEEALSYAEQAVASDPSLSIAWRALGYAARDIGLLDRALVAFRKAAETGLPSAELRLSEARVLRELGRPQESLAALDQALGSEANNPDLWLARAWTLLELDRVEDTLKSVERARENGATPRQYHHDRGDLLLLSGRYAAALKDLEEGLKAVPDDWDLQIDRLITLACLGQQGPLMEALPDAFARVLVPPASASSVCEYAHDVALSALRRGENPICLGLLRTSLELEPWTSSDWFGKQLGQFLRHALETQPQLFIELVQLVHDRLKEEKVLKLIEPFLKAGEFLQTKNVTVLERLFPEVRELVLDIVKRVDPALHEKSRRMI
jgi:tetratricopeptide (TPR) repeat protein